MSLPSVEEILLGKQIKQFLTQKKTTNTVHDLQYAARSLLSAQTVAGDYYDFIPVGHGSLGLLIADIFAKDLPSRLLAARLRAFLQLQEKSVLGDVRELTRKANEFLYHSSCADVFASFFFGRLDGCSGRLSYVNCAQVPPLVVRLDGSAQKLSFTAPVIGISEDWVAASNNVYLEAGDTLVMVTDGVTEALDRVGQQFGYSRLLEVVRESLGKKPAAVADAVVKAVNIFSGGVRRDDLTVVVARVKLEEQFVQDSEMCAVAVGA